MRLLPLLAALSLLACAGENSVPVAPPRPNADPLLGEDHARELISGSSEFRGLRTESVTLSLPYSTAGMTPAKRNAAYALRNAGWIKIDSKGRIRATPKARQDRRFFERNDRIDVIPIASKEIVRILSLTKTSTNERSAAFEWRWIANEIGRDVPAELLPDLSATRKGTATIRWDGFREWNLEGLRSD